MMCSAYSFRPGFESDIRWSIGEGFRGTRRIRAEGVIEIGRRCLQEPHYIVVALGVNSQPLPTWGAYSTISESINGSTPEILLQEHYTRRFMRKPP